MGRPPKNQESLLEDKQGIDMKAEEVLLPDNVSAVQFGKEEIVIKPMSLRTALTVGKFITKNFGRAFNSEAFQKAKQDTTVTEMEMWIGVANEFLATLSDDEVMELLSSITEKDKEFIKANFTLAGLAGVVRALVLTEDFEQIFLEIRRMSGGSQKKI